MGMVVTEQRKLKQYLRQIFKGQDSLDLNLTLLLTSCVTLDKLTKQLFRELDVYPFLAVL